MFFRIFLFLLAVAGGSGVYASDFSDFDYYQNRGKYTPAHYTISRGLEHYSIVWYPSNVAEPVYCFVFCLGTGALPEDYTATAEHLASHGFAAIYVPMRPWDVTRGLEYCRSGQLASDVPELSEWVDSSRMGVGGHSGGGPYAVHAASGVSDVAAIIAQHAASIPVLNKQSNETMHNLKGALMVLCGTQDHMPFCDCPRVEEDYFDRAPLGRVIAKVPDGHISGACFSEGEQNEAGYITAMLYYTLKLEAEAEAALREGKNDDDVTVDLHHVEA